MTKEHQSIACQVINAVARLGLANFLKQSCKDWTDNNCDNVFDAYEYLAEKNPQKLEEFVGMLKYWGKVGGN